MLVFEERGKPEYPEKTSRCRVENQQTQPTYDAESGNRTRATLVGGECSHHYAILAPAPINLNFMRSRSIAHTNLSFGPPFLLQLLVMWVTGGWLIGSHTPALEITWTRRQLFIRITWFKEDWPLTISESMFTSSKIQSPFIWLYMEDLLPLTR